jgi:hypothetical protein
MSYEPSKYDPLRSYLGGLRDRELPMAFRDVERVLGFSLPPSARRHPAWWSNNRGTNVAVRAWRDAGWHTSRVNITGETLVFVRDGDRAESAAPNAGSIAPSRDVARTFLGRARLSRPAVRLLEDYADEKGCDLGMAAAEILNAVALERRRILVERFVAASRPVAGDSPDIREDGDAR